MGSIVREVVMGFLLATGCLFKDIDSASTILDSDSESAYSESGYESDISSDVSSNLSKDDDKHSDLVYIDAMSDEDWDIMEECYDSK